MAPLRRLVLDVLKSHEPDLVAFGRRVSELDGVDGVVASVIEIDRDVQNVEIVVEGDSIPYDDVLDAVEDLGASVHSVDEVVCGDRLVDASPTLSGPGKTWLR